MLEISELRSEILDSLINKSADKETSVERINRISKSIEELPSILDKNTLGDLSNGKYEITLREYTDLNSYRTILNSAYKNSNLNNFNKVVNKTLGIDGSSKTTAKDFVKIMTENGMSKSSALKLYTALNSYSLASSMTINSYVSATV